MHKFNQQNLYFGPAFQLAGTGYAQLYSQFANVFDVKRGDINSPVQNIAGVVLAKSLVFDSTDGEARELWVALNKWLGNQSLENLTEVADGIADTIYVLLQLAWALDIPIDKVFQAVHDNNMTKRQADGTVLRNGLGKVLKPAGYRPVDLWQVMYDYSSYRARVLGSQGADNWKPSDGAVG